MPKFIAELDERELAVRIAEKACGMKRRPGMTTSEAYADLDTIPDFAQFKDLARVAMLFFQEHVDQLRRVS